MNLSPACQDVHLQGENVVKAKIAAREGTFRRARYQDVPAAIHAHTNGNVICRRANLVQPLLWMVSSPSCADMEFSPDSKFRSALCLCITSHPAPQCCPSGTSAGELPCALRKIVLSFSSSSWSISTSVLAPAIFPALARKMSMLPTLLWPGMVPSVLPATSTCSAPLGTQTLGRRCCFGEIPGAALAQSPCVVPHVMPAHCRFPAVSRRYTTMS